jgi:hypothetical protein
VTPQLDASPQPDITCSLPPGFCHWGKNECPAGYSCEGCYACKGMAYWTCGCSEIVECMVCSECVGKCVSPPSTCPGDPNGLVCDIYLDGFSCPPGARRTVVNCRPFCQDTQTCAEVPSLPSKICGTNNDCLPTEYCHKDGLCVVTGAAAGSCQPRPQLATCPMYKKCPDVCGCDGKTYCDVCQAHAAGVSIATASACLAPTCDGLELAYEAEVKKAKQCCLACAAVQCATTVPAKLACGCDTMVNQTTPGMKAVRDEWLARGCMFATPPCGIKCASPLPGTCEADATSPVPTCVDGGGD